jgi:hypothetical protein
VSEYELLYVETMYTIKHKVGSATSKYSGGENDLYAYAQEAFRLSNEEHQRLLAIANEEKVRSDRGYYFYRHYAHFSAADINSKRGSRRSERARGQGCKR